MNFWSQLLAHLQSGQPAYVALVADNTQHSPGTRGAKMFVRPDGSTHGTIGGGVMEADVIDTGLAALAGDAFEPESQRLHHRKSGDGAKSGLICAGRQTNVYRVFEGDDIPVLEDVVRRIADDRAGLLRFDSDALELVDEGELKRDRAPIRLVESDSQWRYEEQLLNWKRAAIIGGGHCGTALTRVLANLGYAVTLFDTRGDVDTFVEDAHARHKVVVDDFADAGGHIEHKRLTHVIVMTMGQPGDVRALLGTITDPYPYIGVMGSNAKLAKIRRDLLEAGIERDDIDRMQAPIGVEMTSNTPEEIAISVAAELLQLREQLFPHARPAPASAD